MTELEFGALTDNLLRSIGRNPRSVLPTLTARPVNQRVQHDVSWRRRVDAKTAPFHGALGDGTEFRVLLGARQPIASSDASGLS